jgi:hypothetical protein
MKGGGPHEVCAPTRQGPNAPCCRRLLRGTTADTLRLNLDGYQFPKATDPSQRYSWHIVTGRVECRYGEWDFRWQALTYDESANVSAWLRVVADWLESTPGPRGTSCMALSPVSCCREVDTSGVGLFLAAAGITDTHCEHAGAGQRSPSPPLEPTRSPGGYRDGWRARRQCLASRASIRTGRLLRDRVDA